MVWSSLWWPDTIVESKLSLVPWLSSSSSSCNVNWNWIRSAQTLLGFVVDIPSPLALEMLECFWLVMFCSFHFSFLVFGLCLHFARQDGQEGKKEIMQLKWPKYQKPKKTKIWDEWNIILAFNAWRIHIAIILWKSKKAASRMPFQLSCSTVYT